MPSERSENFEKWEGVVSSCPVFFWKNICHYTREQNAAVLLLTALDMGGTGQGNCTYSVYLWMEWKFYNWVYCEEENLEE